MNGATSGHEDNKEKVKYWDFFCFLSPFFASWLVQCRAL